jgi:PAP2 superfamily
VREASLIGQAWRLRAGVACVVAAAAFAALSAVVAGGRSTAFDNWTFRELYHHIGYTPATDLLIFSLPALSIASCAAVAGLAALARRWDLAALAVLGPTVTVALTKWVLKPLLGRDLYVSDFFSPGTLPGLKGELPSAHGVFPSGHEAAVASTAWVLVIVLFQLPFTRRWRAVLVGVVAVWTALAAIGLARNLWHYLTDTIGSMLLATVVVLGLALLIDRYGAGVARAIRERTGRRRASVAE